MPKMNSNFTLKKQGTYTSAQIKAIEFAAFQKGRQVQHSQHIHTSERMNELYTLLMALNLTIGKIIAIAASGGSGERGNRAKKQLRIVVGKLMDYLYQVDVVAEKLFNDGIINEFEFENVDMVNKIRKACKAFSSNRDPEGLEIRAIIKKDELFNQSKILFDIALEFSTGKLASEVIEMLNIRTSIFFGPDKPGWNKFFKHLDLLIEDETSDLSKEERIQIRSWEDSKNGLKASLQQNYYRWKNKG